MELYIKVGILLGLLVLGYVAGSILEYLHYRSIRAREAYLDVPAITFLRNLDPVTGVASARLVQGSVVVSIDYFKRFLAGLINLVGGTVTPYETLVDRARREALLRMKQEAHDMDVIVNVRLETSSLGQNARKSIGSVEVLAYGTALKYR